jgi:hypothetical protein
MDSENRSITEVAVEESFSTVEPIRSINKMSYKAVENKTNEKQHTYRSQMVKLWLSARYFFKVCFV